MTTFIVNFSSLIKLRPISYVVAEFAKICDKHATNSYLPQWINSRWNYIWVSYQLWKNDALIQSYKRGEISSETFFGEKLLDVFSFLPKNEPSEELLKNTWNTQVDSDNHYK